MPPPVTDIEALLKDGLRELGIEELSEERTRAFMTYLAELKKWNKAYSLTSLKTDEDIVIKHFLDSCLYLKALPCGRGSTPGQPLDIADVGSGAGFPGLPLKIIRPELRISLIEPSRKKAAFLRHMIRTLGLEDIEVVEKRVEDLSGVLFDAALTRALFSARDFLAKTAHIVKPGGLIILSKGPKFEDELSGLNDYKVIEVKLPSGGLTSPSTDIIRHLVIIKNLLHTYPKPL